MGDHWEILVIVLLVGMIFFGAKRLPEMGSAVGKTIREFQRSMREVSDSPTPPAPPVAPPADRAQISAPPVAPMATPAMPQPQATSVEASHE